MTESTHPVIAAAQRYRQNLLDNERQSATRLVAAYGRAYVRMGDSIAQLEARLAAGVDSEFYRTRVESLRSLRLQAVDEINRFAVYADQEITANARAAIAQGIADSGRIVGAYAGNNTTARQALSAGWDMLPAESVETMLGFLAPDSPLHTRLVGILGETVAQRMETALTDAIALGFNPRKTAAIARRELGVGLTWALNTARTAQMYAYREATRANYMANSDVVAGWRWYSALDRRVCFACLSKHWQLFPVTATLNGHHSCRCVAVPDVPLARKLGINMPDQETGEQWFRRQPEDVQLEMMGPGMFDAWQLNQFNFKDLSQPYRDPVYGTMLRQSSLKDLLARGAPSPFGGGNRPPSGQEVPSAADMERARLAGEQKQREEEMQRQVALEKERLRQEREAAARREQEAKNAEARVAQQRAANRRGEIARLGYDPDDPTQVRQRLAQTATEYQTRLAAATATKEQAQIDLRKVEKSIIALEKRQAAANGDTLVAAQLEKQRAERDDIDRRWRDAERAAFEINRDNRRRVAELVEVRDPARITVDAWNADPAVEAGWQSGADVFGRFVSARLVPSSEVSAELNTRQRAFYDLNRNVMSLEPGTNAGTIIHELGHWLEGGNPSIHQKAVDFLNRRTAGEAVAQLPDEAAGEVGRKDKFMRAYMGRDYVTGGGNRFATEIVSMGIEYMYDRPLVFALRDPDMFDFIFNLVRGL